MTLDDYRNWLGTQFPQIVAPDAALVCIDSGWDSRVLAVNGRGFFVLLAGLKSLVNFVKNCSCCPSWQIIVDPHADRLVGVIDWGDARVGDPALDFTGLLASWGANFVRQVLESYARPVDGRFWERMTFYRDILPFYQMHYGLEFGDKRHFWEALQAFTSSQNETETDVN